MYLFSYLVSLWIIKVEGFFLFCSLIRDTASSQNILLQIPSFHKN